MCSVLTEFYFLAAKNQAVINVKGVFFFFIVPRLLCQRAREGVRMERFLEHASKGKGNCGQAGGSCDFSNCSEPSEADDNVEEYNSSLFRLLKEIK